MEGSVKEYRFWRRSSARTGLSTSMRAGPLTRILLLIAAVAVAVAAAALYKPPSPPDSVPTGPATREVSIKIYRNFTMDPQTLRAHQGETLVLRITSQVAGVFHVHEPYDVTIDVGPGKVSSLTIEARHAGRFEIELHVDSREIGIGVLEILPR